MKDQNIETKVRQERCLLVALCTKTQDERKTAEYLDELAFLATTAGAECVARFTQKADGPSSVTYVGGGKLQEIRAFIDQCEDAEEPIDLAIFDESRLFFPDAFQQNACRFFRQILRNEFALNRFLKNGFFKSFRKLFV